VLTFPKPVGRPPLGLSGEDAPLPDWLPPTLPLPLPLPLPTLAMLLLAWLVNGWPPVASSSAEPLVCEDDSLL